MRDIIITLIVFGSLPFIFKRPYIGILMYIWISVMNPHRLSWGFAFSYPFAAIVAATTLVALLLTKDPKQLPRSSIVWTYLAFCVWMVVTTLFAFFPAECTDLLIRMWKTAVMTVAMILLIKTRRQIYLVVCALCLSIGYYGAKGGVFTVASGGASTVWGPEGSYIEGNNEVALAFITIIPMMYFLVHETPNKWIKRGILAVMALCAMAALGSYSRGALVGIVAMMGYLWWKSPKKAVMGTVMVLLLPAAIAFMPDKWTARMDTINTYEQDESAMGRINAWKMATNLALERPLVGGGFHIWTGNIFALYAPNPNDVHAAHSIYFQVLGEHGFVGLGLYLLLATLAFRRCSWIVRMTAKRDDLKWAATLGTMIQVSLLGFAVGGAFLSLAYYDVPYYLMALVVCTGYLVENTLKAEAAAARASANQQPRAVAAAPQVHA
ncbi:putative O-glycosylation ligase, exosortase A system-associated [Massilia eurypsychrophila]|uniref:Putative O-glycosylation ligase, exosortase A system-associated n=1 Tax=Massilia eurypsychrophila TaxID=1485217 RepID=A0A2G8TLN5_9BURK|nr:putative O-glycosylation ligase, exosortase A system-associated [Massilia eurypsychrophila]PIL46970.1 putative O-glycosylation ligase, exosortase A system-associated [Massilia eurypsychrophila]